MTTNKHNIQNFTDPESALDVFDDSVRKTLGSIDALGGPIYQAKVLSRPTTIEDVGFFSKLFSKGQTFTFIGRIEEIHGAWLDDPCDISSAEDPSAVANLINEHTEFIGVTEDGTMPDIDDIVRVELKPGTIGKWNVQTGGYIGMVAAGAAPPSTTTASSCETIKNLFDSGALGTVGDTSGQVQTGTNAISDLENEIIASGLPDPSNTTPIEGKGLTGLEAIVESEIAFWSGKDENHTEAYARLKQYWDNLAWTTDMWTPSSVPWSAAFISYVAQKADQTFPASAAHRLYAADAWTGRQSGGAWHAFSLTQELVKVQVGDILVKPRSGAWSNTHGDIVYKIEGDIAYLAGGNVSDTGKEVGNISLTSVSVSTNPSPYVVILKKMA